MTMNSYAVYDRDTGEVVHLHIEPAELNSSPEEILQMAGHRGARHLDLVAVPREGAPAESLRVVDGRLVAAERDPGRGAAGGAGLIEPAVPRRYARRRPGDAPDNG
ncbi:MAG TPA: hypothetical protein VF462_02080 [Micromonosporaceae bacterium]